MNLKINGEDRNFDEGITLLEIMKHLMIEEKVMAAAVNMAIVKKDDWMTYQPHNGDVIELLHFVGGG